MWYDDEKERREERHVYGHIAHCEECGSCMLCYPTLVFGPRWLLCRQCQCILTAPANIAIFRSQEEARIPYREWGY